MTDYIEQMKKFYTQSDFCAISGQKQTDGTIYFKDPTYYGRKSETFLASSVDKVFADAKNYLEPSSLYVHVPFCNLRCSYCDFFRNRYDAQLVERYVDALRRELFYFQSKGIFENRPIKAIFFGGGTPTVLKPEQIYNLLREIKNAAELEDNCEITIESSILDMSDEKFIACIEGGATRFSFGVQTFKDDLRKALGRTHTKEDIIAKLKHMATGKAKIIIDLIYGLPNQSKEDVLKDIDTALEANVSGFDLYKLQIFPKSPLGEAIKKGSIAHKENTAFLLDTFLAASEHLAEKNIEAISCCHWRSRKDEISLYNTLVKCGTDLVSLGSSCGGRLGPYGYMKTLKQDSYIDNVLAGKFASMGFVKENENYKLLKGINGQIDQGFLDFSASFYKDFPASDTFAPLLEKWLGFGLVKIDGNIYRLTNTGRFYYRTLTRVLLSAADFYFYGKGSFLDKMKGKMFNKMENLK
ncbi:MAG: radical SAM protein [Phascolarctobacterium sp.]|nr:radical SAM protein [Phascolarctobacterium sp.]